MNELLTQLPALSKPLLHARLSESQWKNVEYINSALNQEYECRKAMVLKRLDVTIQSFKWSDKAKVLNILFLAQRIKVDSRFTPTVIVCGFLHRIKWESFTNLTQNNTVHTRAGVNSAPELELIANSNSGIGIELELS